MSDHGARTGARREGGVHRTVRPCVRGERGEGGGREHMLAGTSIPRAGRRTRFADWHSATSLTPRTTSSQSCQLYRPTSRASICESKRYERRVLHTHSRKRRAARSARRTPIRKRTAQAPNPSPRLMKTRRRNPRRTARRPRTAGSRTRQPLR